MYNLQMVCHKQEFNYTACHVVYLHVGKKQFLCPVFVAACTVYLGIHGESIPGSPPRYWNPWIIMKYVGKFHKIFKHDQNLVPIAYDAILKPVDPYRLFRNLVSTASERPLQSSEGHFGFMKTTSGLLILLGLF